MRNKKVKIVSIGLVAFMLLTLVASCTVKQAKETGTPEEQQTVTITDSSGRVVDVPQPLERIAVWDAGVAEVIRALGATDKIVGISDYMAKYYPYFWPELQDRPTTGSWAHPDCEKLIDAEPQVLFTISQGAKREPQDMEQKMEAAGIKVIRMDFYKIDGLVRDIKTMGLILGKEERAEEFANFFQSKVDLVDKRVKEMKPEERNKVYFESGHKDYYAWGPGSSRDKYINKAGGINIFADLGVSGAEVDPEEILTRDPDVVMKGPMGAD